MSSSLLKDTASIILEIVLSCIELGLFKSQYLLTGGRGATDEGTGEEDEDTEGATVNVVLLNDVSGLSSCIWLFIAGSIREFFSVLVEMILDLLTSGW